MSMWRQLRVIQSFSLVVLAGIACLLPVARLSAAEYRAFWVDAWGAGFLNQSQVDTLLGVVGDPASLGTIRSVNCNSVFVQVRRNCDACYPSSMGEPYFSGLTPSNFNALQAMINAAHDTTGGKKRIDVHAWIVTFRTSGGTVYTQHDDTPTGSLTTLDNYWPSRDDAGAEVSDKAFDPGHPLALKYTADVAMDLVNNFDIDGIHYDYIRFTSNNQGYNPTSIARYNARYGLTGQPDPSDEQFRQWRRDQVTGLVRQVYARIQASKPNVKQSGAFVTWNPSPTASTRAAFQVTRPYGGNYSNVPVYSDWDGWMEEGILDMAVPMTYYNYGGSYQADWTRWMNFEKDRRFNRHMIVGPGIYLNSLDNAILELQQTRDASPAGNHADGFCGYSYRTPYTSGNWATFSARLLADVTPTWDDIPTMPWKTAPTKGHISGTVTFQADGRWADGAQVSITGPENRGPMYVDGTGFYAFIDLTPGTYTITATKGTDNAVTTAAVAIGAVTGNMYVRDLALGTNPLPVISDVQASGITTTSATITWTTDLASTSQVEYGTTTSYGTLSPLDGNNVTSHSVALGSLTPGTLYHYRVISANSNGTSTSSDYTFTTVGPPIISDVQATDITATAATITWTTDQASTSRVEYGTTTSYGTLTPLDSNNVTSHSVSLSGLTGATLYHYRVISTNANGTSTSSDYTFTTLGPPAISNVQATSITGTSATITWTTDQASSSQVEYGTTTSYGTLTPLDSNNVTSHSVNLTGLVNGTLYHYRVISANANGSSTSGDFTFTAVAQTPPLISGVTADNWAYDSASTLKVDITWTTDVAADSQVEYGLTTAYGSTSTLDPTLVTSHTVTLSGLSFNTTYHYRVRSANAGGTVGYSADYNFFPLVIDNADATGFSLSGTWSTGSSASVPKIAGDYRYHRNPSTTGTDYCRWTPTLAAGGDYDVYVFYQIGTNRNTAAQFTVYYDGGTVLSIQNQNGDANQGGWFKVGSDLPFAAGSGGYVEVTNKSTDTGSSRYISADAALFVLKPVDSAPPTTPVVTDDGAYTASTTQLHASWTSFDADSGIQKYEYRVLRQGGTVIRDWTNVGTATQATVTGLSLVLDQNYFFEVRATDNAGNVSAVGSSDGIMVFRYDVDGNGKVAKPDFDAFVACVSGSAVPMPTGGAVDCARFDADADSDVDADDFGVFQRCFTGTGANKPTCFP